MSTIKKFGYGTDEWNALAKLAKVLTEKSPKRCFYYVDDTYFDYGQDWMWTTIICNDPSSVFGGYQALNPREQEDAVMGRDPYELADEVLSDKYCPDRVCSVGY